MSDVDPLSQEVERGLECYHGTANACESYRCGSECSNRFDRMHPCPACLIERVRVAEAKVARLVSVHERYFDTDGRPGVDDTTPEPEDVWRYDRDFRTALASETARERARDGQ